MINKSRLILIVASLIIIFVTLLLTSILSNLKPSGPVRQSSAVPTSTQKKTLQNIVVPKDIQTAPTYPPEKGAGIDMSARVVATSIQEIEKLSPYIPYEKEVVLPNGQTLSVLIPPKNLQNNPWTLTVQIFGIDYNTSPTQKGYSSTKEAFRQAAGEVFTWMKEHDVNPRNIYISWGEKAYMQDQAEKWLKNN